jgi:hypothetical protein
MEKMAGAQYWSSCDLCAAFTQIPISKRLSEAFTMSTASHGLVRPTRLIFGWISSPGYFNNIVLEILGGVQGVVVFCDDLIIFSKTKEEHFRILEEVWSRLEEKGLSISAKKCHFLKRRIDVLGSTISRDGVQMQAGKMMAIQKLASPKTTKQLLAAIGLVSYYRAHLPGLAKIAKPLYELTRAKLVGKPQGPLSKSKRKRVYVPFVWQEHHEKAWQDCKALVRKKIGHGYWIQMLRVLQLGWS